MAGIFMSYRRADSISATGRLHEYLEDAFGADNVFKDVEDIPPGVDFRDHLRNSIAACNVVIVMIGNRWVNITDDDGNRRLLKEDDWVRTEVATALSNPDATVIPVLIEGAKPPQADDLPDDLKDLAYRNAFQLRNDPDFPSDARKLIEHLRPLMGDLPQMKAKTASTRQTPRIPRSFIIGLVVGAIALFALIMTIPIPVSEADREITEAVAALTATVTDTPQAEGMVVDPEVIAALSATPTANSTPNAAQSQADEAAGFYRNDRLGYSFEYPEDWEVIEGAEADGMLIVEGEEFLIFVYDFREFDGTLEELSRMVERVFPDATYTDEQTITVAGETALEYTWLEPPDYRSRSLAIMHGDWGFIFAVEPLIEGEVNQARQEEIFTQLKNTLTLF